MGRSYFFSFIIICCLIFSHPVFAQEFLCGQVLKVNEKKEEFVMHLNFPRKNVEGVFQGKESIQVRPAMKNILPNRAGETILPGCVTAGNHVRVWGHWEKPGQNMLLAHDIRGCVGGGCSDPTGILSRLKKASRFKKNQRTRNSIEKPCSGGSSKASGGSSGSAYKGSSDEGSGSGNGGGCSGGGGGGH